MKISRKVLINGRHNLGIVFFLSLFIVNNKSELNILDNIDTALLPIDFYN